jgi:hypothetical protein
MTINQHIKEKLRKAIGTTNIFASTDVDASMKKINAEVDFPESLTKAYQNMLTKGVRTRTAMD